MSDPAIRAALEKHLLAMTPAMSTEIENVPFTPVNGVSYQKAYVLPAAPDNSALGSSHYIELGIFQISLMFPQGNGSGACDARARAVRSWFRRGLSLQQAGVNVRISHTPAETPGRVDRDRWRIDVTVRYHADIFPDS